MRGWPKRSLGEVAKFVNGRAFKPSDWSSKGVPIVRIQNLTNTAAPINRFEGAYDERHSVRDGTLLVSWSATLDVFIWDRGDAILNQHIFKVIPDPSQVSKSYLFYALKSAMDELRSKTHGTTMKHITKGPFERTEISVPPLEEQARIVAMLDDAEMLRKLRAKADQRATDLIPAMFHQMFGKSKPDGRQRWPRKKVNQVVELINGRAFKPSEWSKSGLPIIRIQNLKDPNARLNFFDGHVEPKHVITKGNLLISWAGQLVSFGVHIWDGSKGVLNQHIFKVEPKVDFEIEFLRYALDRVVEEAKAHFQGSEMKHLTKGTLDNATIVIPPISLQQEFATFAAEIRALKEQQGKSRCRLEGLFQSMLHDAFSGVL